MFSGLSTQIGRITPLGYQQLTTLSSAAALTVPTGTKYILMQAQDKDVRYRDDGTDPSATVGMIMVANTVYAYTGNFATIKFFETSATAKLNVLYYG